MYNSIFLTPLQENGVCSLKNGALPLLKYQV